jgi:hypothetical protein
VNKPIVLLVQAAAVTAGNLIVKLLNWTSQQMGDNMATERGPKEQAALDALDEALDRVQAWRDDDDESDAAAIAERTQRINGLLPRPSQGQATDALTQLPVDVTQPSGVGPADPLVSDPVVTPEESGSAATDGDTTRA